MRCPQCGQFCEFVVSDYMRRMIWGCEFCGSIYDGADGQELAQTTYLRDGEPTQVNGASVKNVATLGGRLADARPVLVGAVG